MKKTNGLKKGFTLIELIVVIAIIAVLAAVLVPNMIGYVKTSKISSANQSAKTIHTAASAWVIDRNISGGTVGTSYVSTGGPIGSTDMDLTDELGANFTGQWTAFVSTSLTGVDCVIFCQTAAPTAGTHDNKWTAAEQKANTGAHITGCYPIEPETP